MNKKISLKAVSGLAMLGMVGFVGAAGHGNEAGQFEGCKTDGQLFSDDGSTLGCNLIFSAPGIGSFEAEKGSAIDQSVPALVWEIAGLSPDSDYLKSSAIHSVASAEKTLPWPDVQKLLYASLLVEGASEADAKIAYAGAHAFAPRWSSLNFIEVDESSSAIPDTVLYAVEYTEPAVKGISVTEFRALVERIADRPSDFSLQQIQVLIDNADAAKARLAERAPLGGVGDVATTVDEEESESVLSSVGILSSGGTKVAVAGGQELLKSGDAAKVASTVASATAAEVKKVVTSEAVESAATNTPQQEASTGGVVVSGGKLLGSDGTLIAKSGDDKPAVEVTPVNDDAAKIEPAAPAVTVAKVTADNKSNAIFDTDENFQTPAGPKLPTTDTAFANGGIKNGVILAATADELARLKGPADEWATLDDGTLVLRNTTRLVSQ